jgi:hypothetical protein
MTLKADKLEPGVFRTMLQRGRGAALLHVLKYGLDGVEDLVLQACLSNLAYDPQCEGTRAPWLYRMFKGSPQYARFSAEIRAAMSRTTEHWDLVQLCDLTGLMAIDGDAKAASTLRDFVLAQEFSSGSDQFGCEALVKLDGLPALAEIGRRLGAMLIAYPNAHAPGPDDLMEGFEEHAANLASLERLAAQDTELATYLDRYRRDLAKRAQVTTQEQRQAAQRERMRKQYSIDYILSAAQSGKGGFPGFYRSFGMHATREELEIVLQHILLATSPPICQRLLWVFDMATMPRIDARIWELAEHQDEELRDAAIRALSRVSDPAVGMLGRSKLRAGLSGAVNSSVVDLFTKNYVEGDADLILAYLERAIPPDEETHCVSISVLDICKENSSPSIAGLAEWTYQNTPCSVCRSEAVEQLLAVSKLPPAWTKECCFDANRDIQALSGNHQCTH